MLDVEGALDYVRGDGDADDVGLTADDAANDVIVDLVRPAAEFVTVVASPTFGDRAAGRRQRRRSAAGRAMRSSSAAATASPR